MRHAHWIAGAIAALLCCTGPDVAHAQASLQRVGLEADVWVGAGFDSGTLELSRLTVKPTAAWSLGDTAQAMLGLRLELADDDTGLGSLATYSSLSRPLLRGSRARLEIDQAVVTWRGEAATLTVGKQTVAWGVLDGLQVTDRFDPIRRRDFVLTETRPERLSRWGLRWRQPAGEAWLVDMALALDPTVSQQAVPGTSFAALAPRSRGGMPALAQELPLEVSSRGGYFGDATAGLRLVHRGAGYEWSVLAISGPETDPQLRLPATFPTTSILLEFPRRTLLGTTLERSAGARVWRVEAALVPDQPVNLPGEVAPISGRRSRMLVGMGLDWNAPAGLFMNAQLGVDHVEGGDTPLTRPRTDWLMTLRLQKSFANDAWRTRAELIGSVSDGDGVMRWALERVGRDAWRLGGGVDMMFGDRDGLFGQYRDRSRSWLRATATF